MSQPTEALPEEIRQALELVVKKYEAAGWKNFRTGRPEATYRDLKASEVPRVSIHATSPAGQEVHGNFDEDQTLPAKVDAFLRSR
jgi:hypothetical protein